MRTPKPGLPWGLATFVLVMAGLSLPCTANPPNIVFILADDLGFGDLACYGHPYAQTPELDKLASEGTLFRRFYVTGMVCCASRTGFMTSRHPASFAKYMSDYGFGGRVTVTQLLKQAGYSTGHFGKWHMGPQQESGTYGIDRIEVVGASRSDPGGRDAGLFQAAIRFIEANKDKPFYVNVWGHTAHYPVDPAPCLVERFGNLNVDRSDFGAHMQEKFKVCERIGGDVDESMRKYLGDVYSLDLQVGLLLRKIDELGLRDNTIVVFSSDQGPAQLISKDKPTDPALRDNPARNMLGYAGGLRGGKHTQWEGGVRSPFIIRWPGGAPAGKTNYTSVFSAMDWLPTVCALAGVPVDGSMFEGEDVSDIWRGADRSRAGPLFWKASRARARVSMLEGDWKLHVDRSGNTVELYDLSTDAEETRNVAEDSPEVLSALREKLDNWQTTLPTRYAQRRPSPAASVSAPMSPMSRRESIAPVSFSLPSQRRARVLPSRRSPPHFSDVQLDLGGWRASRD